MKIEEFIECTKDELLAVKRNSFSRGLVEQHSDIEFHEELMRLGRDKNVSSQLATYLFACKNLTIHAIDEKQSPVPFSFLSEIYQNTSFLLQFLPKKKVYALTLFRNEDNSDDFTKFFRYSFYSGSNALKENRNESIYETLLDFGLLKCAMSLNKTYGIQDLLEIAWQIFNEKHKLKWKEQDSEIESTYPPKAARFMFSIDHPELSIITLYADEYLNLAGLTKTIDESEVNKVAQAISFLDFQYNIITKGNKNGSSRTHQETR